jgi:hypothetical protein
VIRATRLQDGIDSVVRATTIDGLARAVATP